jgi:hypothetical protein
MRKMVFLALALVAVSALPAAADGRDKVLEFDTMAPVVSPFLAAGGHPIRNVTGGGVPWALSEAKGELKANGKLEISVRGLVIVSTGVNPSPQFRAIVSCLTADNPDETAPFNIVTQGFPATTTGDADIEAQVALPAGCFAPVIFVTNGDGTRWFAVTGRLATP